MKLTGKAKIEFEYWYINTYCAKFNFLMNLLMRVFGLSTFYMDTISEQWGVYVDFFDFKNIEISITPQHSYFEYLISWSDSDFVEGRSITKDRNYARRLSITGANDIYDRL